MAWRAALLLVAALTATAAAAGWHDAPMDTIADFDMFRTLHSGFVVLVYAPWCGHSRALLPEAEKAAERTVDVPFFKVDGTQAEALATRLDVKGYPTLMFVRRGDGEPITYDGERQAGPIAAWAKSKSAPHVASLATPADISRWVARKRIALVLFATDGAAAHEYEALSSVAASAGSSLPCAVSSADPGTVSELSTLGDDLTPPVLVAFTTHGDGLVVLRGTAEAPLTHASMLAFGLTEKLPNVNTYASGATEEEIFEADVPMHLLYFHRGPLPSEDAALAPLRLAGRQLKGEAIVTTVDAVCAPPPRNASHRLHARVDPPIL